MTATHSLLWNRLSYGFRGSPKEVGDGSDAAEHLDNGKAIIRSWRRQGRSANRLAANERRRARNSWRRIFGERTRPVQLTHTAPGEALEQARALGWAFLSCLSPSDGLHRRWRSRRARNNSL